jgi:uncharacterized protein YqeY
MNNSIKETDQNEYIELLDEKFLNIINKGLKYRKNHLENFCDLKTDEEIIEKIQKPMFNWWKENGLSDDEMKNLFSSKYGQVSRILFTLLILKGLTF